MAVMEEHRALPGRPLGIECFRRFVSNLDRSIEFYCDALGFELDMVGVHSGASTNFDGSRSRARRQALLVLGSEAIELLALESDVDAREVLPTAASACSPHFQHFAIVAADMDTAFSRLSRFAPAMISAGGPIRLPPSTGSVTALKFRDPDGHPLELIVFPPGTGDARWQRRDGDAVTLGIDHSAIVVTDADRSIAFYRDVLGCSVPARQTNRGAEQDRLDGLPGVQVDVVALRPAASATPHLELLGYRQPHPDATCHRTPSSSAGDCIVWAAQEISAVATQLARAGTPYIIGGDADDNEAEQLLLRDPDGHIHLLRAGR